jgi:Family of unknown function (DUF6209)
MMNRLNKGKRPQITFTSDFHELVRGDLSSGQCVLCYDPLRLADGYDQSRPRDIKAFVRFHPSTQQWSDTMTVPPGVPLRMLADPAAQGYVLQTAFDIPKGCDELEAWFSYTRPNGETRWDSDFGKNYWLRFPLNDLKTIQAVVHPPRQTVPGQDLFEIEVTSVSFVESVEVRWRVANFPQEPRRQASLIFAAANPSLKRWSMSGGGVMVPRNATVLFDLVYYVAGHQSTDDNQGQWYIADRQTKLE